MTSKLEQMLAKFRITFIAEFNDKITLLNKLWLEARTAQTLDAIKKFRFEVHSLKGSSGALNFLQLSDRLGLIEIDIAPCEEKTNRLKSAIPFIDLHMKSMSDTSNNNPNPLLSIEETQFLPDEFRNQTASKEEASSQSFRDINIALIDNNQTTSEANAKILTGFGFAISQFDSIESLEKVLEQQKFNLVLIDTDNTTSRYEQIFAFAAKLKLSNTDVFILSSSNTFENRLAAVRAQVNEYLLKPVNVTTLVSEIRKNLKIDLIRPYRILLLDDQALVSTFYKTLLEDQGVEVLAITQAESIMTELESYHPDVFLLDKHMPNISGLEVAQLLRQQAKYDCVPIIFLTSDDDLKTKLEVLKCGGDDVIPKNTAPHLIVQQVDSRIQRGQEIRYIASRDSLTGVLNHGQIMDVAAHTLRLTLRQQKTMVVVMIDLDLFKTVNDRYGHLSGDKVLISLGQLLLQSVRETDYVGRYGGEEFMVVFSDADPSVIAVKIKNILTAFQELDFTHYEQTFQCSFSAGLASSNHHTKLNELIASADTAMYKAKDMGRNQVCFSD